MADFEQDTRVFHTETGWQTTLSPDWQVTGPQGGYVAAIALRAMAGLVAPGFLPAALTAQYLTPASAGPAEVEPLLLRQGRRAAFTTATVRQHSKIELGASASFFQSGEGPVLLALTPPVLPAPEQCRSLGVPAPSGPRFPFHENYDLRFDPETLREPDGTAEFSFWASYREHTWGDDPVVYAASLIPLLDMAVFTAAFRFIPKFSGAVTLDLTAHWHTFPAAQGWIILRGRCLHAGTGMLNGWTEAWTADGSLLATAAQQAVIVQR
jgi:acyl-CoA thioesterase-2